MGVSESSASTLAQAEYSAHLGAVVDGFKRGMVTPILGAGVNITSPPRPVEEWKGRFLPSGRELADHLATRFEYPSDASKDLMLISQYACSVGSGEGALYEELHSLFDANFPITRVHQLLARVPRAARAFASQAAGNESAPPLILTTNYDDLMERALRDEGEEFDLLVHRMDADGSGGRFFTSGPDGKLTPVAHPQSNDEIDPDQRTVIVKLHGFVDRGKSARRNDDSYVITEDNYIEYLAQMDIDNLLPCYVLDRMRNCSFLFLGYSLADWNLRALLHRLAADRRRRNPWWAIQLQPSLLDVKAWEKRDVKIFDKLLSEYIDELSARFDESIAVNASGS